MKMIVLKLGGSILGENLSNFYEDLRQYLVEDRVVIVHGGSYIVNDVADRMGVTPRFIVSPSGFRSRYTDIEMIDIFKMVVAGKVNKDLVAKLQSFEVNAIGLSGIDCSLIKARRKKAIKSVEDGSIKTIEDDYTGRIRRVNVKVLRNLISLGYTPVVAPLAVGEEFESLNVDGDRLGASITAALGAERLIIFTDVEGVLLGDKLIPEIKKKDIREMIKLVEAGMKKKLYASMEALDLGVEEVIICSIFRDKPLASALLHKSCTVIGR